MKDIRASSRVFHAIREIWRHLSARRKRQSCLLALLTLLGGFSEAISLGLVAPFLAALASPEKVLSHPWFGFAASRVQAVASFWGVKFEVSSLTPHSFLPFFGGLFVVSALLAGGIRLLLLWSGIRLANAAGLDLAQEVYRRTLYQPLSVHAARNSSSTISSLTTKIPLVTLSLSSFLNLFASVVIALSLIVALLAISPETTLLAGLALGIGYAMVSWINAEKLAVNSRVIAAEQDAVIKTLQEGLGGIRDILLDGTQKIYGEAYRKAEAALRRAHASTMFLSYSPRYFMESLGMVFFAALALVLCGRSDGLAGALPVLGALALGVQRLLPVLQQGYVSWSSLLAYQEPTREVVDLLEQPMPAWVDAAADSPIRFEKEIRFDSVGFRYNPESPKVLSDLSFSIPKGGRVGFVGRTGSGKSTCLDLLMGLLEPTEGQILIDDQPLDKTALRSWQRNIAHVPQTIFLSDNSLAENIAFGTPPEKINLSRVREAATQAQIADFIESKPEKYGTFVGERGIRLSGGQRQRIGIARALYKQAKILVFDEATSALDSETEAAILESLKRLSPDLTVLMIAHRLTSLKNCSQVISLSEAKAKTISLGELMPDQAV
jgi:ABC-type multidrug transport system fused ATPase/permease subunit